MKLLSFLATVLVLAIGAPADAQDRATSFEELRGFAKAGDTVSVTRVDGEQVKGTVSRLSPSALTIKIGGSEFELRESDVTTIRRRGDPRWNGALIGAASGAGVGLVMASDFVTTCDYGGCAEIFGGWGILGALSGAGIGALVDAFIRSDHVIYERPGVSPPKVAIAPMVGDKWGVLVSLRR